MSTELRLRRKLTLRTRDQQVVFIKKANEHASHVYLKAFLWALYLPAYPSVVVEVAIGDRFKPDVVALNGSGQPQFWGEAGQVSPQKIRSLVRRYRHTHFAVAKWDTSLDPLSAIVKNALTGLQRFAPFDLLSFPADSYSRFVDARGEVRIAFEDVDWIRLR